jgi:hypothetical protein
VTEPVRLRLNALVDSGSVDQARAAMEAFKKQQAAEDILLAVHGDISKAENDIFALLGWTKEQDGTVNIEGNKYPYEEAVKAAKEYAEGTTGTVTITGDDGEARVVAQGTQSYINSLTGTINLTATIRKEELQRMTREAARIVEDAAGRQMTVGQADKGTSLITMGVGGVVIPTAATAFGGPTFSPAVVGTSLRSTIAQGRAMGAPSAGGMSGLLAKGGAIGPLASGHHGAGGDTGSVEDSTNVAVPSDGGGSATPTVNIIVKIGDRDITDIVDVQMNGRMGQLATAMRRAG